MNILDQYIVKKYLSTFFFLLGIVVVICVVVDFNEKLDDFLDKKPPLSEIIFDYYFNFIPFFANLLSPICIFLAVIFFTSKLAQRTELIPVLSSGVSFYRLLAPYIIVSIFLAGISFLSKAYLVPISTTQQIEFEYKYLRKRKVHKDKNVHKRVSPDTYVYINYYNKKHKEAHGLTMERRNGADFSSRLRAEKAVWVDSTASWKLKRVWVRDFSGPKHNLYFRTEIDTTFLLSPDDIFIKEMKEATMTLPELKAYIELEEMRGSDILEGLYFELHRRYADPFAVIILTMIGFAMSSHKSRGGIALQIGLGLLICFVYVTLLFAGKAIMGDEFSPALAVWMPNIAFLPLALFLLWKAPK